MVYIEKKQEVNFIYWLVDKFSTEPISVTVVDEYPDQLLALPTISLDWDDLNGYQLELGTRQLAQERTWYIEIFASTKGQRKDFAYKIFNDLQEGVPIYELDTDGTQLLSQQLGTLVPVSINIRKLNPIPELIGELYWRSTVTFVATYDTF